MKSYTGLAALVLLSACALGQSARAAIVYGPGTITDTGTDLVWQVGQIPTATFIATGGWTVATESQFETLITDAGLFTPGPYSSQISTFFSGEFIFNPLYNFSSCPGPASGGNCFNLPDYKYQALPTNPNLWAFQAVDIPADNFGPTSTFTGGTSWGVSSVSAFEVQTPVPLPASAWLILSGVMGLGLMATRRRAA